MNPGCPETDAVQAYVDGAATLGERAAIEQHIQACGACRDVLMLARTWTGEPAPPAAILRRDEMIDRFIVDGVLGAGGMGVVYSARDPELDRRVALKLLREESSDRRERLAREAQALARVAHPNVCAVYDIGTHDGRLFIAMELVAGQTLGRWAQAQRPWRDIVAVFAAAARGLVAAHGAGVIHRDFKPDNVLVGDDGRVRVTDFGLASWVPEAAPRSTTVAVDITRTGAMLGTPRYMAPEQHAGEPADERSDQWSFTAALYEALYGQLPFAGNTATELAEAKAGGHLAPAPSGRRVPRWLDRLVRRGLAVRRADRWPSMAVVVEALERRRARRHLVWIAALVGALAIALTAVLLVRRPPDRGTDAARLAALAESMEAGLRIERLAPPHDMRPARAKIRAEVERLRPQAADGDGAASFALGKGLELLGDDAGARDAYQRAWTAGFRLPRVADGLGTVLSNLYRREYRTARGVLAGAALDERLAVLHRELAEPAMRYLSDRGGEPWRAAMHRATIALLARDFPAARAAATEALAADPGRYEARALEAEAWRSEALFLHTDRLERTAPLTRALEAAEAGARHGRSDQQLALLAIDLRWMLLLTPTNRGETTAAALDQLLAAVDEAAALDPDEPQLLVARAKVLKQQVRQAQYGGVGNAGPLREGAIAALRRAAELDGGEITTLEELAQNLAIHASSMTVRGDSAAALPLLDEGLRAIDRAVAREPQAAKAYARGQQLHKDRAAALRQQHRTAEHFDELRRTVAAGEQALRLGYEDSPMVQVMVGGALINLAEDAWRSGRDPRADARRGLALVEDGQRRSADDLWADSELILGRGRFAEQLVRLGDDPAPLIAQARAAADRALALRPDAVWLRQEKGWVALLDARARIDAGRDPGDALAEAERLLAAVVPEADEDDGRRNLIRLAITRAHWQVSRGNDPTSLLRKAQADIDEQARRLPRWGEDLVVAAALEAARWARRTGRPAEAEADARRGLAAIAQLLTDDPRDVSSWVPKAALEALAGDRAQAAASLARAVALNPLVRGARAYQDAEALIGH